MIVAIGLNYTTPLSLRFVNNFRVRAGKLEARQPLHMFFTEVSRHDRAQLITMPMRQVDAVHCPSKERGWVERFLDRNGVGILVDAAQPNSLGIREWSGGVKEVAQRNAFPNRVAHQSGVEPITDAHQRRLLLDQIESF